MGEKRAWAGVKRGAGEAATDFMALTEVYPYATEVVPFQ